MKILSKIGGKKSPNQEFVENPSEFLSRNCISTCIRPVENPQTGIQKFNLIRNDYGAKYFLSTSNIQENSISSYWLVTKETIEVDLNDNKTPSFVFTPELQGCALYVKLDQGRGKMKIFHRMFGSNEDPQKTKTEDQRLKQDGYNAVLTWEEYGMPEEEYQKAKKSLTPFVPVTAIFYRDPVKRWTLLYQKIKYELDGGMPQPNFNYIKSITKVAGPSAKYIEVVDPGQRTRRPGS